MLGHSFEDYNRVYAGFSVAYTFLHALRAHIYDHLNACKLIFNGSYICGNSTARICEMNAQIYAPNNDHYIRVLNCAYVWVSQITWYVPARKVSVDRMAVRV